jgi:DNA-binding NarL/FixJ family response regulator
MSAAAVIRVCLIEDQNLVREGLESLIHLTPDIRVIATAADGRQALEVVEKLAPDLLLLDLRMPCMDGLDFLRHLNAQYPAPPPAIILTTFDDDASVLEGLRLGAKGYLLKDVSFSRLTEAIRTVAGGGTLVSPAVTERLLRGFQALPASAGGWMAEGLTEREIEILRLMTGGFSNREIASALSVVEGTVKNHVSNILGKLGVRDRVRAVLKAIELGYV